MSPIGGPHQACYPLGNPFRMILPKDPSLSPELLALLNKFEETLSKRLIKLKPIHKDDVFTFSWMSLAMNLLSETHSDIESLITELKPVYNRDDKWIGVYGSNNVKLLKICDGFSSKLSKLRKGRLLLHHLSRNLEGNSSIDLLKAKSSIDRWRQHIVSGNTKIENCISISLELPKVKTSAKGKVLIRAMYGVQIVTLFVGTVFVSAFSGSNKKLKDLRVTGTPLWREAFNDLQGWVYGDIRNLKTSGRNVFLTELEAVDICVNELYPIILESKYPVDSKAFQQLSTDLRSGAEKLSSGLDLLSKEVDGFSQLVVNGIRALFSNLLGPGRILNRKMDAPKKQKRGAQFVRWMFLKSRKGRRNS